MPQYTTLQAARRQILVSGTVISDDAVVADYIALASQEVEDFCGQNFDERIETYGFSGEVGLYNPILNLQGRPLLAITQILNGDGSALAANQYQILPNATIWPKTDVRITVGNAWTAPNQSPTSCPTNPPYLLNVGYSVDAIQISGLWGFNRYYPSAWKASGFTVQGAHTVALTTLTLNNAPGFAIDVGSVLKVTIASGASEYLAVTGPVASSTAASGMTVAALTVQRGYNNSTALAFVGGETVYVWQVDTTIDWATREAIAAAYHSREDASGESTNTSGQGSTPASLDLPTKVTKKLGYPLWSHWRGRYC